ncbi:MAG: hypothetical protein ACJAZ2_000092 [Glaciecola sp.]|jgi:hypothetical protein
MLLQVKTTISTLIFGIIFFCTLNAAAQNKVIDRKIQYFFSDYYGKLDTGFTATKTSSTCFLIDSTYADLIAEHNLPQHGSFIASRLFNNNWFKMSGKDYDITLDPYEGLLVGYETALNKNIWYNKRGVFLNGRFGQKIKIHSYIQEGPIKPEPFISDYINTSRVIPGEGEVHVDGTDVFGRYSSFGGVEYKASKFVDLTLAHGKNFLGEGYRSLILSDAGPNYLFGRMDFHFGEKINYTTIVSEFIDYRPDMVQSGNVLRQKKYGSYHYLDIALTKKFHVSLYEAIIWGGDSAARNTLELNYLNPFVVMRPFEFGLGSPDKVLMGTAFKYTPTTSVTLYGQFLLTEFYFKEFFAGNNWWGNKYAGQAGVKFHNFKFAKNLYFQLEYNHIRPFTYNHRSSLTSFSHSGQPLAHPSGSNLKEGIFIANHRHNRWNLNLKSVYRISGLPNSDSTSVGTNVLMSYYDREADFGNVIGQGVSYQQFHNTFAISYMVNPSNLIFVEAGVVNRHQIIDGSNIQQNYFFIGLKTGIINNYYDF